MIQMYKLHMHNIIMCKTLGVNCHKIMQGLNIIHLHACTEVATSINFMLRSTQY